MSKHEIMDQGNSGFLALAEFDVGSMSEELQGLSGGFDRIKIPAAGSTVFEVPGEEPGETDAVKEFSAVILYHHPLYAFYRDKYVGGNNPPDCGSYDGKVGVGMPGGSCERCPYNQFGSGENGGKACKNRRRIYLLREGEVLPLLLSLPTGSLKEFGKYIKRLLAKGKKSSAVVTRFSLKKETSGGGIAYSQAVFALDRALTPEECALIQPLTEQVKAHSVRVGHDSDAPQDASYTIDPETGEIIQ